VRSGSIAGPTLTAYADGVIGQFVVNREGARLENRSKPRHHVGRGVGRRCAVVALVFAGVVDVEQKGNAHGTR